MTEVAAENKASGLRGFFTLYMCPVLRRITTAGFIAWCLAQSVFIFTLPLLDALGGYREITQGMQLRFLLIFVLTFVLLVFAFFRLEKRTEPDYGLLSLL
ncbi:MAG: hypothetical protein PHR78_02650, partial [Eubacteriales bacterium]|nr:hypothetical protein [Eubacteriales bacterium]